MLVVPEPITTEPGAKLWLHKLAMRNQLTQYAYDVGGKIFPRTALAHDELYVTNTAVQSHGGCLALTNAYLEGALLCSFAVYMAALNPRLCSPAAWQH